MHAGPETRAGIGGECGHAPATVTGRGLPALTLPSTIARPVDLAEIGRAVLYFYPGSRWSPEGGYDSPPLDEAQHRAFADHWDDFLALNCQVLGVSSEAHEEQATVAAALGLGHPLLCDGDVSVGRELGLPTFSVDHVDSYFRMTLIVNDGVIVRVFYPLSSVVRSAAQAVAWMRHQRWV
jgi:peroxiredoxin